MEHVSKVFVLKKIQPQNIQIANNLPKKPSSSIEWKCPSIKKLKGEGNFPSYFDNNEVKYI